MLLKNTKVIHFLGISYRIFLNPGLLADMGLGDKLESLKLPKRHFLKKL